MRILVATDIHGSRRALEAIPAAVREHKADVFAAAGDITHFGSPPGFVRDLFARVPVEAVAVPGNCDPPEVHAELDDLGVGLHLRKRTVQGTVLVGLGGSNPTPFGTPFELGEDEILRGLEAVMEPGAVLVSHPPPRGHLDVVPWAGHVGSESVARVVAKYRPRAVLCGHIHEARGTVDAPVPMMNPGPAKDGHLGLADIGERVLLQLL